MGCGVSRSHALKHGEISSLSSWMLTRILLCCGEYQPDLRSPLCCHLQNQSHTLTLWMTGHGNTRIDKYARLTHPKAVVFKVRKNWLASIFSLTGCQIWQLDSRMCLRVPACACMCLRVPACAYMCLHVPACAICVSIYGEWQKPKLLIKQIRYCCAHQTTIINYYKFTTQLWRVFHHPI